MYDQATDAPAGLEEIRCPHCGGLNRAGAQWCGQCLERFVLPKPLGSQGGRAGGGPPPPPPPPPPTMQAEAALSELSHIDASRAVSPPTAGAGGARSSAGDRAFLVGSDGITWACKQCETSNSIETDVCSGCGMPLADLLRAPAESRPGRDPNTVALISMIFPGAGHGYLGEWGQAIARAVVSLLVLVVAGLAYSQTGLGPMTAAFSGVSFVFWAVTAHDAFQEAAGAPSRAVLKGRSLLWLVMGILMLLMGMLVIEGLQVNAAVR